VIAGLLGFGTTNLIGNGDFMRIVLPYYRTFGINASRKVRTTPGKFSRDAYQREENKG